MDMGGGLTKLLFSGGIELASFRLETKKKKSKHWWDLNQQPFVTAGQDATN